MVAACWLGVVGTGSGGVVAARSPLPQVTGSLRSTPRGSNITMSKSSRSCGRERAELVGHVVDARHPGAAGVDDERADAGRGVLGRMPGHRDRDRGPSRVGVVERHDQRAALEVAVHGDHEIGVTGGSVTGVVVVGGLRVVDGTEVDVVVVVVSGNAAVGGWTESSGSADAARTSDPPARASPTRTAAPSLPITVTTVTRTSGGESSALGEFHVTDATGRCTGLGQRRRVSPGPSTEEGGGGPPPATAPRAAAGVALAPWHPGGSGCW